MRAPHDLVNLYVSAVTHSFVNVDLHSRRGGVIRAALLGLTGAEGRAAMTHHTASVLMHGGTLPHTRVRVVAHELTSVRSALLVCAHRDAQAAKGRARGGARFHRCGVAGAGDARCFIARRGLVELGQGRQAKAKLKYATPRPCATQHSLLLCQRPANSSLPLSLHRRQARGGRTRRRCLKSKRSTESSCVSPVQHLLVLHIIRLCRSLTD
jgi:hypothetical protein